MSALPPIADIKRLGGDVCFVPEADIELFDHLVGPGEHGWWHGEAERFGGFEVDH